jgi:hypothetical protein
MGLNVALFKRTYHSLLFFIFSCIPLYFFQLHPKVNEWFLLVIFLSAVILQLFLYKCLKSFRDPYISTTLAIAGCVVFTSIGILDMVVTLIKSPDLAREGNPIAIFMFSKGLSTLYVKYALYFLSFHFVISGCLLWLCSLKSANLIVNECPNNGFFRNMLQIYAGKNHSLKNLFHQSEPMYIIASVGAGFIGVALTKIYCVLEWFELVPYYDVYCMFILVLGSCITYLSTLSILIIKKHTS